METKTPDGTTLRYDETGSGAPAIVFVHGWCCNRTNWRDQVPTFSRSHRVLALDQRGHGESDKPDQDYTIAGFVDDLAWFIRDRGLERPVIVGHSMGGVIALNLVRKHPELARAIVMIDSPSTPLPEALQPVADSTLAAFQTPLYKQTAEGFARSLFFNEQSPKELVEEIVPSLIEAPQRLMHTALADLLSPASLEPGPVGVPALYIRAATNYAPEGAQEERYPGIEVAHVDAAHFLQMEKPAETNVIIDAFLAKVTAEVSA